MKYILLVVLLGVGYYFYQGVQIRKECYATAGIEYQADLQRIAGTSEDVSQKQYQLANAKNLYSTMMNSCSKKSFGN